MNIDKLTAWAEQVYAEDRAQMERSDAWAAWVRPQFLAAFPGMDYRPEYEHMHYGERREFLEQKRAEFEAPVPLVCLVPGQRYRVHTDSGEELVLEYLGEMNVRCPESGQESFLMPTDKAYRA